MVPLHVPGDDIIWLPGGAARTLLLQPFIGLFASRLNLIVARFLSPSFPSRPLMSSHPIASWRSRQRGRKLALWEGPAALAPASSRRSKSRPAVSGRALVAGKQRPPSSAARRQSASSAAAPPRSTASSCAPQRASSAYFRHRQPPAPATTEFVEKLKGLASLFYLPQLLRPPPEALLAHQPQEESSSP